MAIEFRIDRDSDSSFFTSSGRISFTEALEVIKRFYADNPTANVLWDFDQSSFEDISAESITELALFRERFRGQRTDGKTALVASRDVQYGLLRIFKSLSDSSDLPFEVRVFREMDKAREWLGI